MMSVIRKLRGCEYEAEGGIKDYLKEHFSDVVDLTWRVPGHGHSGAKFGALPDCRARFAARFGGTWPWDYCVEVWGGKKGVVKGRKVRSEG
jgi:hypothetical protein